MTTTNTKEEAIRYVKETLAPMCVDQFLSEYLTVPDTASPATLAAKINVYAPASGAYGEDWPGGWKGRDGTPVVIDSANFERLAMNTNRMYSGQGRSFNIKVLTEMDKLYKKPELVHQISKNMASMKDVFGDAVASDAPAAPDDGSTKITNWTFQHRLGYISQTGLVGEKSYFSDQDMPAIRQFWEGLKGATPATKYVTIESNSLWGGGSEPQWVPLEEIESYTHNKTIGNARAQTVEVVPTTAYRWTSATALTAGDTFQALGIRPRDWAWIEGQGTPHRLKGITDEYKDEYSQYVMGISLGKTATTRRVIARANNDFVARIARNFQDLIVERLEIIIQGLVSDAVQAEHTVLLAADQARNAAALKEVTPDNYIQDASDLKPFDAQCFLVENIKHLTSFKDALLANEPYSYMGRIANIDGDGEGQPGNIVSYINHGNRSSTIDAYLNICPDVYALLSPYIKVYRVDYLEDNTLVPYKETQIPFPNFINPRDIDRILDGDYGRFPGAGIKSFSWSLDGVQPAEVENNISANLQLYFQTVQDLFSMNYPSNDAGASPQAGIPNQAGYLDLIIGSGTSFRTQGDEVQAAPPKGGGCLAAGQVYKGERFRIKVCVGWNIPDNFETMVADYSGLNADQASYLKNAILLAKTSLYLQITTHQLTFNDDGSVDMSIDYQAALSGILKAPNADLFIGSDKYKADKEDLDQKISDARKEVKRTSPGTGTGEGSAGSTDPKASPSRNELKKLLEQKAALTKKDKLIKYRKFLGSLYDSGKIYTLPLAKDVWKKGLLKDLAPDERAAESVKRLQSDPMDSGVGNPQAATELDTTKLAQVADVQARGAMGEDTEEGLNKTEMYSRFILTEVGKDMFGPETIDIPFIFLGDLLESILKDLGHLTSNESFQLLVGNVEIIDPLLAFQVDEVSVECETGADEAVVLALSQIDPLRFSGINKIVYSTNITNLPISLAYFQEWFTATVVRPQKEQYSLLSFIKNVCASLIGKAFNSVCFDDALSYFLRFDTATFNLDNIFVGKMSIFPEEVAMAKGNADVKGCQPLAGGAKSMVPTVLLYSVDSRPFTGDYDTDLSNGIYHYFMGSSCGLAKTINFQRNDMPYYREARLSRTGALGAEQLRELYSVNIAMVGNTIHRNGQYIYVEPVGIGIGSAGATGNIPNLAKKLGFGGYYMITKVESTVSETGFDTTISALQEGINLEDNKILGATLHVEGTELYAGDGDPPNLAPGTGPSPLVGL